jgi:hypothetical protein
LNLCGQEGIGKSRLAIETATYLSERDIFKIGVFYVDRASYSGDSEFLKRILEILKKSNNK